VHNSAKISNKQLNKLLAYLEMTTITTNMRGLNIASARLSNVNVNVNRQMYNVAKIA